MLPIFQSIHSRYISFFFFTLLSEFTLWWCSKLWWLFLSCTTPCSPWSWFFCLLSFLCIFQLVELSSSCLNLSRCCFPFGVLSASSFWRGFRALCPEAARTGCFLSWCWAVLLASWAFPSQPFGVGIFCFLYLVSSPSLVYSVVFFW